MPQLTIQTDTSKTGWMKGNVTSNYNKRDMVLSGKRKMYKCVGTHCRETCNTSIYQGKASQNNPLVNK